MPEEKHGIFLNIGFLNQVNSQSSEDIMVMALSKISERDMIFKFNDFVLKIIFYPLFLIACSLFAL